MAMKRNLKNLGRRGLSLFMATVMSVSLLQITAFGAGTQTSAQQIQGENGQTVYYQYDPKSEEMTLHTDGTQVNSTMQNREVNPEVKISKTIAGTSVENQFDITLDVETTQPVSISSQYPDAAVSIVMDVSGSMEYCSMCIGTRECFRYCNSEMKDEYKGGQGGNCSNCLKSKNEHYLVMNCLWSENHPNATNVLARLQAAKIAATTFVSDFAASAKYIDANNVAQTAKRYISLVTFNTDGKQILDWVDVTTEAGLETVKSAINGLGARGGTDIGAGLALADALLQDMPTGSDTKPMSTGNAYVLLLGDGTPEDSTSTGYAAAPAGNYATYNGEGSGYTGPGYTNPEKWARKIRTGGTTLLAAYAGSDKQDKGYNWFTTFTNQCALGSEVDSLKQTFENYITMMRLSTKAWIVHDPMGTNITFEQNNTPEAHITPNATNTGIEWTLRADVPTVYRDNSGQWGAEIPYETYQTELKTGSTEVYHLIYSANYTVTLDSTGVGATSFQNTNGPTYLSYFLVNEKGEAVNEEGQLVTDSDTPVADKVTMPKLYFKVPAVKAFDVPLSFTKTNATGELLDGAGFQLYQGTVAGENAYGGIHSSTGGAVAMRLPSGQSFMLDETVIPAGYTKAGDLPYQIDVAWGQITGITNKNNQKVEMNTTGSAFTVANPRDTVLTTKTVTKNWNVPDYELDFLPKSIEVTLTGAYTKDNQTDIVYQQTKSMQGTGAQWTATFADAPTYSTTGEIISYTVTEGTVAGYQPSYNQNTLTITNTWLSSYEVTKIWVVEDSADKTSVKLALLQNGVAVDGLTVELVEGSHTFENVPYADANGIPYNYTLGEWNGTEYVSGGQITLGNKTYDVSVNGRTIINKLAQNSNIAVSGTKTWIDPVDATHGDLTIKLQSDAKGEYADVLVDGKPLTAIVNDENPGYSFENLNKYVYKNNTAREINYRVVDSQSGYVMSGGNKDDGYNLTNTIEQKVISIPVTKVFVDNSNEYATRPDAVTIQLLADGAVAGTWELTREETLIEITPDDAETSDVNESVSETVYTWNHDSYQHTFTDLPVYDLTDGHKIVYTVKELGLDVDGKLGDYVSTTNGFTITNTLDGDTTAKTVQMVWQAPGATIPATADVTIIGTDGSSNTQTLSAANNWSYTWDTLAKYADGKLVEYTITGDGTVDNRVTYGDYTFDVTNTVEGQTTTITNRIQQNTSLTLTGEKSWVDNDSVRPVGNITVYLQSDVAAAGKQVKVAGQTASITSEDGQSYTFENLPRFAYDTNSETGTVTVRFINYNVMDDLGSYVRKSNVVSAGTTESIVSNLTNIFQQTYTYVEGTKTWVDGNSTTRPTSILVGLFKDGILLDTQEVSADTNWSFAFGKTGTGDNATGNLPVKRNDNARDNYVYTIRELANANDTVGIPDKSEANGYTVTYQGFNIINTRSDIDQTRTISVTKFWRGPVPTTTEELVVELWAKGSDVMVQEITVAPTRARMALTSWTGTSDPVNVFDANGTAIEYYIVEAGEVDGIIVIDELSYDVAYNQENFTLTNTIQQDNASIQGLKTWELGGNVVNLPDSLTIALYADGNYTKAIATTTTSEASGWAYDFGTHPVYDLSEQGDGHKIVYTIRELDLQGNIVESAVKFSGKNFTTTYDNANNVTNAFQPNGSDVYGYQAQAHYTTHYADGTTKTEVKTVIDYTFAYDAASFTINPTDHLQTGFTYDAVQSGLYVGADKQELTIPEGSATSIAVATPNSTYKVELHYSYTEPKPEPQNFYYRMDINYTTLNADGGVKDTQTVTGEVKITNLDSHTVTPNGTMIYNGVEYTLTSATEMVGNLTGTSAAAPYVFIASYSYTEPKPEPGTFYYRIDTSYTIFNTDGSVYDAQTALGALVGVTANSQTINPAASIVFNGVAYTLTSAPEMVADLTGTTATAPYVFNVSYSYTLTSGGGGGGTETGPDAPVIVPDPDVPLVELPEVDVPLVDLPEVDVPLVDLPEVDVPLVDLPEEDVPLANVPATGDNLTAWVLAAAVSGIGLVWLVLTSKKRKEEDGI